MSKETSQGGSQGMEGMGRKNPHKNLYDLRLARADLKASMRPEP